MRRSSGLVVVALVTSFLILGRSVLAAEAAANEKPRIDIVFCIDCSGSMGPLRTYSPFIVITWHRPTIEPERVATIF